MGLAGELFQFLRARRRLWMLPFVTLLLLVGALMLFTQGTVMAPFIYSLF
jgi:hypothetical protein